MARSAEYDIVPGLRQGARPDDGRQAGARLTHGEPSAMKPSVLVARRPPDRGPAARSCGWRRVSKRFAGCTAVDATSTSTCARASS